MAEQKDTVKAADGGTTAQQAEFEELQGGAGKGDNDIGFLLDIPLDLSVKLGQSRMIIKDLLSLSQGSVIELDKLAGEPMDVLVNDKLVAKGEVVVVNEKFGIRLTDILSPAERIKQLG